MSSSYLPYRPADPLLLPPSLQEWLPSDHLSHFISDTVDQLDLSSFHEAYDLTRRGNQPYHPTMMVKILLYAYSTGVFSSRRIARCLREDVAFRSLAAGNYPAHRTICDFRNNHLKSLESLFVQVVGIARECKIVRLGTVAIDGTKIQANASRHKAMSYGRMLEAEKALQQQIQDLLRKAEAVDCSEFGKDESETSLPEELAHRRKRLETIQAAKQRLEERQREMDRAKGRDEDDERKPRGKDGRPKGGKYARDFGVPADSSQESFTDPQSRIMPHSGGNFEYSYNCQAAVDRDSRIIVAAAATNCPGDAGQLVSMVHAVQDVTAQNPKKVLADAGYRSEAAFTQLEAEKIRAVVALGRDGKEPRSIDPKKLPASRRMARRMSSLKGKADYKERKWIVEPVFGWAKRALGFRQMSMRGLEKASAEWKLVCTALNLRRMNVLRMAT
ncbi:MAG: IS1182 family transposase [Fibrobacteria bacterium]|nr:IS1182 family transposase [Fibrobacteria bacterium]